MAGGETPPHRPLRKPRRSPFCTTWRFKPTTSGGALRHSPSTGSNPHRGGDGHLEDRCGQLTPLHHHHRFRREATCVTSWAHDRYPAAQGRRPARHHAANPPPLGPGHHLGGLQPPRRRGHAQGAQPARLPDHGSGIYPGGSSGPCLLLEPNSLRLLLTPRAQKNKGPGTHREVKLQGLLLVGATGFEPATTCTPSKCATRLRYAPLRRLAGAAVGAVEMGCLMPPPVSQVKHEIGAALQKLTRPSPSFRPLTPSWAAVPPSPPRPRPDPRDPARRPRRRRRRRPPRHPARSGSPESARR